MKLIRRRDKVRIEDHLSKYYGMVGVVIDVPDHVPYASVLIEYNKLRINTFFYKKLLVRLPEMTRYKIL